MKRYLAIIMLVIVTIISISGGIAAKEDSKPNIAVLPFKGWESRYNKKLADKLIIQLINSNRFNVIDRSLLNKILEEQEFQATGLVNQDTAVKLGKIAGVNKLITGNLTKTIIKSNANKYQVDLQAVVKIIDVKTGKYFDAFEVAGKATKSTQEAAIINALNKAANKIYLRFEDKFIIKAKVTTKQGKEVIIDKGQSDGVKPGMKFSVLKQVNGRTKRITTMSITSVKKNLAYGQLKKSNQQINTTCFVQEIKSKNNLLIDDSSTKSIYLN